MKNVYIDSPHIDNKIREEYSIVKGYSKAFKGTDYKLLTKKTIKSSDKIDFVFQHNLRTPYIDIDRYLKTNTKFIYYYPDILTGYEVGQIYRYRFQEFENNGGKMDILLTPYKIQWNHNNHLLAQGVEPSLFNNNYRYSEKEYDWTFIGTAYSGREQFLDTLDGLSKESRGVVYGRSYRKSNIFKDIEIYNDKFSEVIGKSKLAFHHNRRENREKEYAFSVKLYKMMASGGVVLAKRHEYFPFTDGKHYIKIDKYSDVLNLKDMDEGKLQEISDNAYNEVLNNHTYEKRGKELIGILNRY